MSTVQEYYRDRYAGHGQSNSGHEAEPTFRLRVGAALKTIEGSPRKILDFGCNIGGASKLLSDAGHQVVGVDISESAIRVAQSKVPAATFKQIDSEVNLPLPDESFEVCFCSEVIEHLFDVSGFIKEIHRVLKQDGLFLITTPYHGWLKNLLVITLNFEGHFAPTGGHIRFFSKRSIVQCLEQGQFNVEAIEGIGRFWPLWKSMYVVARKIS